MIAEYAWTAQGVDHGPIGPSSAVLSFTPSQHSCTDAGTVDGALLPAKQDAINNPRNPRNPTNLSTIIPDFAYNRAACVPAAAAIWCLWLLIPYEIDPKAVLAGSLAFFDAQRSGAPLPNSATQSYPWLQASGAGEAWCTGTDSVRGVL